jgi:LysR family hydrogen peroxide-inducible transcriptional activator
MELRQLEYLVAIAEERHFTRAAQRLNVAQPTLSHQIRRLELELGIALVNRTTRRVSMTDAGDRIVRRARRVLSEIQAVEADADAARGLRAGKITIGLTPAPGAFDLPSLLSAFASIASQSGSRGLASLGRPRPRLRNESGRGRSQGIGTSRDRS